MTRTSLSMTPNLHNSTHSGVAWVREGSSVTDSDLKNYSFLETISKKMKVHKTEKHWQLSFRGYSWRCCYKALRQTYFSFLSKEGTFLFKPSFSTSLVSASLFNLNYR